MSNVVYVDFAGRRPAAPANRGDVEAELVTADRLAVADVASVASKPAAEMPAATWVHEVGQERTLQGLNRTVLHHSRHAAVQLDSVRIDADELAQRMQQMHQESVSLATAMAQLGEAMKRLEDLPRQARAIVEAAF